MAKGYLIDTNVLIAFQASTLSPKSQIFIASILDEQFNVSIINKLELLGHKSVTRATEEFIDLANIIGIDEKTIVTTIALRKATR